MSKKITIKRCLLAICFLLFTGNSAFAALGGTYTINGGAPASATNYVTIGDAVSDLMSGTRTDGGPVNGPGVSGPVNLRIAAGTGPYTEQITFGPIAGTSATNYVRLTGGPTLETIDWTNTTTTDRHVIRLSGTKNIILDSLTLNNYGVTYGYGVWITANSDSNFVQNCMINIDPTTTSSSFCGIAITGTTPTTNGDNGDFNTIQNNVVSGGYYGFSCSGTSTTIHSRNNHVLNNEFKEFYYYGIRHYGQDGAIIAGNIVHARATGSTSGYGMYLYYQEGLTVEKNRLYDIGKNGLYLNTHNTLLGGRTTIKNNMIGGNFLSTVPYGIYLLTNSTNVDVIHNSVSLTSGDGRCFYNTAGSGNTVRNNSFSVTNSTTGYAAYISSAAYITAMDHNNYYAPGSSNFIFVGAAFDQATYQGGAGFNTNSRDGDPNYIDPVSNLHAFAAQLFDAGDPLVGVVDDYDGDLRPHPVSLIPDIGADEYLPDSIDMSMVALLDPSDFICPDSMQVVRVVISNKGLNTRSNIPLTVNMTGPQVATLNYTHPGPMVLGQTDTVVMGMVNTWPGGAFNFEAINSVVGDQSMGNDTLNSAVGINLTPAAPSSMGDTICEGDSTMLTASGTGNVYWFDAQNGGNQVGAGNTLNTGPLLTSTSFFAEDRGIVSTSLTTTFANNNSCGGGNMFEITAFAEVTIDSFDLHLQAPGGSSETRVYYIPGGIAGNETNPAAWTFLDSAFVVSAGIGTPTRCVIGGLTIPAGQTYGIYVYNANVVYTSLGATYANAEMSLTVGVGLCGLFSGTNNPRAWNGTVYYNAEGCGGPRTEVPVTVDAMPVVNMPDTTACGSVTLDAGGPWPSYIWSNGDTTQTSLISLTGTYSVAILNGLCNAVDTAVVTINDLPLVALGSDTLLCNGSTLLLDAGNPGAGYMWNTLDITQTINVDTAGTYSVTVTDGNGCEGMDDLVITTLDMPIGGIGVDTTLCPQIDFSGLNTGGAAVNISWDFGDGNTSTATNPSHTYGGPGTFIVTCIQDNGCGADTVTTSVTIGCIMGLADNLLAQISLFPNPTRQMATLQLDLRNGAETRVSILDLQGRVLSNQVRLLDSGRNSVSLVLSDLSAGMYLVQVVSEGISWQSRLIKE